jgi:hypothetical protein
LAVFGDADEALDCSACFGCGFPTGGGAFDAAESDDDVAGAGIVIVGFVAADAGFDADCAVAGGSRRTGLRGPTAEGGDSAAVEDCAGGVASGSAARDHTAADSIAAENASSMIAVRQPGRR